MRRTPSTTVALGAAAGGAGADRRRAADAAEFYRAGWAHRTAFSTASDPSLPHVLLYRLDYPSSLLACSAAVFYVICQPQKAPDAVSIAPLLINIVCWILLLVGWLRMDCGPRRRVYVMSASPDGQRHPILAFAKLTRSALSSRMVSHWRTEVRFDAPSLPGDSSCMKRYPPV